MVESYGLQIGKTRAPGTITCVSTLERIFDKYGYEILERTLRLVIGSWEGDLASFGANILSAVATVYIPSQLGTFLKDDVLLVSYVNRIEKIQSETAWPIYKSYRGYDEEVSGGAILTILAGAKKYSNYNLKAIKKKMESQISWLMEKFPNEYKKGEWHFDFDKAIAEINVGNKTKNRNYWSV